MRKRLLESKSRAADCEGDSWLDLEPIAEVELTSEDPEHPIEAALTGEEGEGWRAGEPGKQIVRLIFSAPQHVRRIRLEFHEAATSRTQEFVIRYAEQGHEASPREVVRQQWNFSPDGSSEEIENYRFDLTGVTQIELEITPDVGGSEAKATLTRWRLG